MKYCIEKIVFGLIVVIIFVSMFSCAYNKQKSSKQSVNKNAVQVVNHVEKKKHNKKSTHKKIEYSTATLIKEEKEQVPKNTSNAVSSSTFKQLGEIHHNGHRFTWYSEKVLPGGGLSIPGRHVNNNGYVCDENGYVALASCDYNQGTVLDTPLGIQGKVYDICPVSGTLDVYVSW